MSISEKRKPARHEMLFSILLNMKFKYQYLKTMRILFPISRNKCCLKVMSMISTYHDSGSMIEAVQLLILTITFSVDLLHFIWRCSIIPVQYKIHVALLQKLQQPSHPTSRSLYRSQNLNGPLYLQELWWHNPSVFLRLWKHKIEWERKGIENTTVSTIRHKFIPALA